MATTPDTPKQRWRPAPLDYLAIIAGLINVVVIGTIIGYALLD